MPGELQAQVPKLIAANLKSLLRDASVAGAIGLRALTDTSAAYKQMLQSNTAVHHQFMKIISLLAARGPDQPFLLQAWQKVFGRTALPSQPRSSLRILRL